MNTLSGLTQQQLRKAADLKERILSLQSELDSILGAAGEKAGSQAPARRGKRNLSAAGRAALSAAAKDRWAKFRGERSARSSNQEPRSKRRKMSAAVRKSLSEKLRARWAQAKKAGRARL